MKNEKSLSSLFKVINDFERGSGAKLNLSKTEALWLGAWRAAGPLMGEENENSGYFFRDVER